MPSNSRRRSGSSLRCSRGATGRTKADRLITHTTASCAEGGVEGNRLVAESPRGRRSRTGGERGGSRAVGDDDRTGARVHGLLEHSADGARGDEARAASAVLRVCQSAFVPAVAAATAPGRARRRPTVGLPCRSARLGSAPTWGSAPSTPTATSVCVGRSSLQQPRRAVPRNPLARSTFLAWNCRRFSYRELLDWVGGARLQGTRGGTLTWKLATELSVGCFLPRGSRCPRLWSPTSRSWVSGPTG